MENLNVYQGSSGTLYNNQLNILDISDIKIINYFNEEYQCWAKWGLKYLNKPSVEIISSNFTLTSYRIVK